MSSALSPDGKFLLVLNGGYNPPSISVLDIAAEKEVGRTPVPDAWLGLAFAPKGDFVYVGGGSRASVFEFKYANGALTPRARSRSCRKRSALRGISSATSRSPPMGA